MSHDLSVYACRCYVSGRVQGVFYRATTRQKAVELGVSGHARNLPDGRVEVLAVGPPEQVQKLIDWLWIGSPASHVTDVSVEVLEAASLGEIRSGFSTK
jgi:acylphosphatase